MKKSGELSFSPIVYAILALIVLAVCIGVFFTLTKTPISSIFQNVNETGTSSDKSLDELTIKLGVCDSSETGCFLGNKYICNSDNRWEKTENDCD